MVNAKRIAHDVPALIDEDAQHKEQEQKAGEHPAHSCVRCATVQGGLVGLRKQRMRVSSRHVRAIHNYLPVRGAERTS